MKKIIALLSVLFTITAPNLSFAQTITPQEIKEMEKMCLEDSSRNCLALGFAHASGTGVTQNYPKAVEYYTKACSLDDGTACSNLGVLYAKGEGVELNKEKAKEFFKKSCDLKVQSGCESYKIVSK
jgi:TPR repeat protein